MCNKLFVIIIFSMLSGCSSGSTPKVEYCEGIQCDMRDQTTAIYKPWKNKQSKYGSSEIRKGISISGNW